jgi:protein TonB
MITEIGEQPVRSATSAASASREDERPPVIEGRPEARTRGLNKERSIAFAAAAFFHVAVLCFGGLLFFHNSAHEQKTIEDVSLIEETKPEDEKPKVQEEIKTEPEPMPEMPDAEAPPPEPLSLGELEVALNPGGDGGGDGGFSTFRLASGRIGATGSGPGGDLDAIFTLAELDQKPRPVFQATPVYPMELRQRKVEGNVYVLFVVDQQGRVTNPTIEKSSHGAFEKPALDAVRQWKFEPAVRNGQKVRCKMRAPIRFSPS